MFNSNRLQRRHIQQRIEKVKTIGYVLLLRTATSNRCRWWYPIRTRRVMKVLIYLASAICLYMLGLFIGYYTPALNVSRAKNNCMNSTPITEWKKTEVLQDRQQQA